MTFFKNIPDCNSPKTDYQLQEEELYRLGYLFDNHCGVKANGKRIQTHFTVKNQSDALLIKKYSNGSIGFLSKSYFVYLRKEKSLSLFNIVNNYCYAKKNLIPIYIDFCERRINKEELKIKSGSPAEITGQEPPFYLINYFKDKFAYHIIESNPVDKSAAVFFKSVFFEKDIISYRNIFKSLNIEVTMVGKVKTKGIRIKKKESYDITKEMFRITGEKFYENLLKVNSGQATKEILQSIRVSKNENINNSIINAKTTESRILEKENKNKQKELKALKKVAAQKQKEVQLRLKKEEKNRIRLKQQEAKYEKKRLWEAEMAERRKTKRVVKKKDNSELEKYELTNWARTCICCEKEKSLDLFSYQERARNKKKYICKSCAYQKYVNKENALKKTLKWASQNKEKVRESRRKHLAKPEVKIRNKLRRRMMEFMDLKSHKKSNPFSQTLGCTPSFLKQHLESQFQRDMSWSNYNTLWCIDHIIPCAAFDHSNQEHINRCWNYKNLKPEFNNCNGVKSDRMENGVSARILRREDPLELKRVVNESLVKLELEPLIEE